MLFPLLVKAKGRKKGGKEMEGGKDERSKEGRGQRVMRRKKRKENEKGKRK